jgi:hypothetical protein
MKLAAQVSYIVIKNLIITKKNESNNKSNNNLFKFLFIYVVTQQSEIQL